MAEVGSPVTPALVSIALRKRAKLPSVSTKWRGIPDALSGPEDSARVGIPMAAKPFTNIVFYFNCGRATER
jgi:hypothetical protein